MKKFLAIFITLSFVLASSGFAAESIGFKNIKQDGGFSYVEWTIVTASDGSLTKTASEDTICGLIYAAEVIPDATTAFTNATTDVRITKNSVDIFEGGLDDLSNTVMTPSPSYNGGVQVAVPIYGTISIDILQNSVDSGACVVKVYYIRCGGNR